MIVPMPITIYELVKHNMCSSTLGAGTLIGIQYICAYDHTMVHGVRIVPKAFKVEQNYILKKG